MKVKLKLLWFLMTSTVVESNNLPNIANIVNQKFPEVKLISTNNKNNLESLPNISEIVNKKFPQVNLMPSIIEKETDETQSILPDISKIINQKFPAIKLGTGTEQTSVSTIILHRAKLVKMLIHGEIHAPVELKFDTK